MLSLLRRTLSLCVSVSLCHFGLAHCRSQCVCKTQFYAYSLSTAGFVKLSSSPTRNTSTKAKADVPTAKHEVKKDEQNDTVSGAMLATTARKISSFIDNALRTGSTPSESGPSGTQQAARSRRGVVNANNNNNKYVSSATTIGIAQRNGAK